MGSLQRNLSSILTGIESRTACCPFREKQTTVLHFVEFLVLEGYI